MDLILHGNYMLSNEVSYFMPHRIRLCFELPEFCCFCYFSCGSTIYLICAAPSVRFLAVLVVRSRLTCVLVLLVL